MRSNRINPALGMGNPIGAAIRPHGLDGKAVGNVEDGNGYDQSKQELELLGA